jgi:hypothetical protein
MSPNPTLPKVRSPSSSWCDRGRSLNFWASSRNPTNYRSAADRRAATASHFIQMTVLGMLMRALFGERLTALRAEMGPHVARTVASFLPRASTVASVEYDGSILLVFRWTVVSISQPSSLSPTHPRARYL